MYQLFIRYASGAETTDDFPSLIELRRELREAMTDGSNPVYYRIVAQDGSTMEEGP